MMSESAPRKESPTRHVVVIGAGIVGAACAVELMRDGYAVTLVEPEEPGGEHAASYGNGGWLSPSLVTPLSMPGLWRKIPKLLLDPLGPLTIAPAQLPLLMPWLVRFLFAGASVKRVEATARALASFVARCDERHVALAREIGVSDLITQNGQIQVYRNRADFEAEALVWRLRRDNGASWIELDEAELRRREPSLDQRYRFGVHLEGANCVNPGAYTAALVRHATMRGATLLRARATGFRMDGARLRAVTTSDGDIACDCAVISAGVRSPQLATLAGDKIPLAAERGYHVVMDNLPDLPRNRVLLMDGRMANTPSSFGLRVTGHVDLSSLEAPPNWKRAEILRDFTLSAYSNLRAHASIATTRFWMGARPSTPDGLPVIGRSSNSPDIIHAFGHGHIGVASSPMTARLVADVIGERPPAIDIAPFAPTRFRLFRRA